MRACLLLVALVLLAGCATPLAATPSPSPSPSCHYAGDAPDPDCAPGWAATAVTQENVADTICRLGYADSVRPSGSYTDRIKTRLLVAYGDTAPKAAYELDHLVPLSLGGDPRDIRNLWPQPWEPDRTHPSGVARPGHGAQAKDRLEAVLHHRVCLPTTDAAYLPLAGAQAGISRDWRGYAGSLGVL